MRTLKVSSIRLLSDKRGKMNLGIPTRTFGAGKGSSIIGLAIAAVVIGSGIAFGGDFYKWAWQKASGGTTSSLSGDTPTTSSNEAAAAQAAVIASVVDTRKGVASAVVLNAYDKAATALTEIYPNYYVFDSTGSKLVDNANANTTTTVKGEKLSIKIGGASYYGPAAGQDFDITSEAPTLSLDAYTAAAETSLAVTAYNSDGTELATTGLNSTSSADYMYAFGANEVKSMYMKLQNNDDQSMFRVGAFCTVSRTQTSLISDFQVIDDAWKEVPVPKQLRDTSLTETNNTGGTYTQTGYNRCYVPKSGSIDLLEFGETSKIKGKVTAGTTAPTANAGGFFGGNFFDASWRHGSDGKLWFDFYSHDLNEQISAVGVDETEGSPQGKTSGFIVELQ